MKTYILLILFGLTFSTLANAQKKIPTAQELTVKNIDELNERLALSPTQKSVIYNYVFDMYRQQLELMKSNRLGTSKEDDVTKFYKFQNETNDNIKNILKGDQIAEFDKLQEERLNGDNKKKKGKKGKNKEDETVTGISGLKLQN
ncbi:hypothetical protein [Pedobacter steynii]